MADQHQRFEAAKRGNIIQVMMRCSRILNERATASFPSPEGVPRLRPAHTTLLPHLDFEGLRVTALAAKLGVTKQAVHALVTDLVAMGVVERVPDPSDGRAKLVRFASVEPLMAGLAHLKELEGELIAVLGASRSRQLHDTLLDLLTHLESRNH